MTINEKFLPTEPKTKFDIVTALLILLFVCTIVSCYWHTTQLENKSKESKQRLYEKIQEYEYQKNGIKDIAPLRKKVAELKDNIVFYKTAGYVYFGELSSLLPNNMKVNDILVNYQPFQKKLILTLSGSATGITPKESVSKFITSIKKSEYFKDATITNLAKDKITKAKNNKDYSWNIKIEFPVKN